MLSVFLAMVLICGASYSCALSMRKKIDVLLTNLLFFAIFFLYIFYVFDILLIGKMALTAVYIGLFLGGLVRYILLNKPSFSIRLLVKDTMQTITPAFVIFFLGCAVSFFITIRSRVHLWDELRLWGAFPKILHFTDKLQLGPNVLSFPIMQSYPPAMPLFTYYLTGFTKNFNEASIFMGYAIFCLAILSQAFRGLDWKKWGVIVPATLLILTVPTVFYSADPDGAYFYRTLFIDPVLGVALGYLFYLITTSMYKSRLERTEILLLLFVTIMLKDSGIVFAAIFSILLFLYARKDKKWDISVTIFALIALFVCAAAFMSWKTIKQIYHVNEAIPFSISEQVFDPANRKQLWTYLRQKTMFSLEHLDVNLRASFVVSMVTLGVIDWWITLRSQETLKTSNIKGSRILLFLSFCTFVLGYYMLFPSSLASFERYMGTVLTCYLVVVLFGGVSVQREFRASLYRFGKVRDLVVPVTVCIILFSRLLNYATTSFIPFFNIGYGASMYHAKNISDRIVDTEYSTADPAKVYVVMDGDPANNSQMHQRLYFDLIGTNAYVGNFYTTTNIVIRESDDYPSKKTALSQTLINEEYDYLYIFSASEELNEQFADWNYGNPFKPEELYKIVFLGNTLMLVPIYAH